MALLDRRMARNGGDLEDDDPSQSAFLSIFGSGWPHSTDVLGVTQTSSSYPYSHSKSTSAPTTATGEPGGIYVTTTLSNPFQPTGTGSPGMQDNGFSKQHIVAAAVVPLILIGIVCGVLLCCLRKRRQRRAEQFAKHESKGPGTELEAANGNKGPRVDTLQATPFLQPQPAVMPASRLQSEDHPIIVAPLNSSSHAYYTGIDTSDVMSVTSTGTRATHMDEPPPPYRPRSIATALSRDSSVRHPTQLGATLGQNKEERGVPRRSPFADPGEDDTISEISEAAAGSSRRPREEEEFSVVSDLSYQQDSLPNRPSVRK